MRSETSSAILQPGKTCWRIERADRLAVIVDAANYFATLRKVVRTAEHCVMFIGWDFDTRIPLDPRDSDPEVPNPVGKFLNWVARTRPELKIYMLKWNLGMLETLGRGSTPLVVFDWMTSSRIRLKLDSAHPTASAHHQKIVVIDDALAFCGGIDLTADRWDTRDHPDESEYRRRPTTRRRYGPWHDATTAVDGCAALALGDLARDRWKRATGETIPSCPPGLQRWPEDLEPSMTDVDVAVSRTMPEYDGKDGVHEIEALYLAIIAATERVLYIESQYFASRKIAEAMADRLSRPDSPEIVIVNPEMADGWLEEKVMGSARARLLGMVRKADRHDRFRIYTPVAKGGTPIYVHAKVLVMDNRLLRVGSSNLNNRSLGFDTECDLSVEATPGSANEAELNRRIEAVRNDLLAEHLGVDIGTIEAALDRSGGALITVIEGLRGSGRTLVPFEPPELSNLDEEVFAENDLLDPERPASVWRKLSLRRMLSGGAG